MTVVERMSATCEVKNPMLRIVNHVGQQGYTPLIAQAKQTFMGAFGRQTSMEALLKQDEDAAFTPDYEYRVMLQRRLLRQRNHLGRYDVTQPPIAGDIFTAPQSKGLMYVMLRLPQREPDARAGTNIESGSQLEVGFIGEESEVECLQSFAKLIAEALTYRGKPLEWERLEPGNPDFYRLREDNTFTSAALTQADIDLASRLEEQGIRDIAIGIRRSGGVLAKDLSQKLNKNRKKAQKSVADLVQAELISRDYVIICRKTSSQINRVASQEAIQQMNDLGVRCSCGRTVAEERVEELFTATDTLNQMLDQSYWMSARLVSTLQTLKVPPERILLNLRDGPEEVDAFVDVNGVLFMFELKDSTFSMGHAYAFSSRIAIYKPDYSVIVATKGVAPEVKRHFKVTQPATNLVYVDQLGKLRATLSETLQEINYQRAHGIFADLEPMATVNVPLSETLGRRVGIPTESLKGS